jgi:hypothetical protein
MLIPRIFLFYWQVVQKGEHEREYEYYEYEHEHEKH